MSPEQLRQLQRLSDLFEQGQAGINQVKELSDLLALVNEQSDCFIDKKSELDELT
ncbi:hypothetical protein [Thalassotalea marina]|uniref:Uncharacterized protein n=1 Tax=Thalassotalea marina TaxID=1673741 RepID=A0A919BCV9_9GAMM|nr:hypothetical protein [Thalassotalea marina]GHF82175.1 hypothetical protein GCM10017161_06690 [Thalassotalea marina]